MLLALLAAVQVAAGDTALFPRREALIRIYTNCNEDRWPWGLEETFVSKTPAEIADGVRWRRELEARWQAYYRAGAGDAIQPTADSAWIYPLAVPGRLLNNFNNPRPGGPHEALDIFVPSEGAAVRAPVSGVVVASGDDWSGGWTRRVGLHYEGGGLSRRAGNGLILYDPAGGGYFYFAHLRPGLEVRTGDIVRAGQALGRVGHTGNAAQPGRGRHLHFAYKRAGRGCDADGVLVSVNPYQQVRRARRRM